MSDTPLLDTMKKLKQTHPDAPAWIMDRAEVIADQRLEQEERDIFLKNSSKSLAGMFGRFSGWGLSAMLNIFERPENIKARQDARLKAISGPNSIGKSFEWAFENLRLAACEYITENHVPLTLFTDAERDHLFPDGLPAQDHNNQPHAAP